MHEPIHFNVGDIPLDEGGRNRTYEPFATRKYDQILEMAHALDTPYPSFLAVLSPERNFLHYVLSGLVCNAAIPSRDALFANAERIYNAHVSEVTTRHAAQRETMAQELSHIRDMAARFLQASHLHVAIPKDIPEEWERFFRTTHETMQGNFAKGAFMPGLRTPEKGTLDTLDDVFMAACTDRYQRKQNEEVAKQLAHEVIGQEIAAGNLSALPEHDLEHRCNVAIAGTIGAGKNTFFNKMVKDGKAKREDYAYIDLDEFKHFHLIVKKPSANARIDGHSLTWGDRAHDECHMIRRKIIDELEEKARLGKAPNALLLTSHLSPRVLNWLAHDNQKTNVYLLTCSPYTATRNAWERHSHEGERRMATSAVINSAIKMAESSAYLLSQLHEGSRLFLQMEDTTYAREKGSKTILKADAVNGIHVYDMEGLHKCQENIALNPDVDDPRVNLFLPDGISTGYGRHGNEMHAGARVNAMLRPHAMTLYDTNGKIYAQRDKGSRNLRTVRDVPRDQAKWLSMLDERDITDLMNTPYNERYL